MSYIVLHNENTEEDFRYDVPQREAQALADLMGGGGRLLRLSWSVREAADDVMVPRSVRTEVVTTTPATGADTPQSGYTPCACRDCMDTAITSDGKPSLCLLCKGAGCEISYGEYMGATGALSLECQRDDAYGEA